MREKNHKWLLLALLCGAYFFHQADRAIFGVLLPLIQNELGLTDLQLGHINTILFLTIAVTTFFAGFLGDRFHRGRIITFSLVFWSLATMGLGWASSFAVVLLLRSVATGGGESFYGPSAISLIASHHRETRAFAFSVHQAALYLGLMTSGFLALGTLRLVGSWRYVFVVFGAAGLLLGLVFACTLLRHDEMREPSAGRSSVSPGFVASLRAFFGNPSALLATSGFVAICCVNNTYITWSAKMFSARFGVDGAEAGAHALFYHHLVAFAAILAGGALTDRLVPRWPRFRLGLQIVALILGGGALFFAGRAVTFAGALALTAGYGLFRGLFEVNTHASVFDVIPAEHRSAVVGFMLLLAMGIGALFSGELMGWVFSAFAENAYSVAFAMMAGAYLLGALLMSVSFFFTFSSDRLRTRG